MNAKTRIVAATGLCMASVLGAAGSASADTVTDWNLMYDQSSPLVGSPPARSYLGALVHIAIHDALNNIDRRYETYMPARPASPFASPDAAIAAAAHDVLVARLGCAAPIPARIAACNMIASQYAASLIAVVSPGSKK